MIAALASACSSVMVVAKEFQLFQPIGGVGASGSGLPLLASVEVAVAGVL